MSAEQIEFLTEYEEWKAVKKVTRDDLSPEAFIIDRAKDQALEKLIKIDELMSEFYDSGWGGDGKDYEGACNELHDAIDKVLNS